ncbi:YbbR-like domain-containing protein [Calidithermus roseus]|uniref:YbbR-like protein n=1 Tax=Calidithermus roseus TaxID=1644118 RepID=A0A399EQJ5_9DEIN|nr:CdaR family protein [Calidithermus roseus]RIH85309.1 YbbR-like protein [Calidithermus roseus]
MSRLLHNLPAKLLALLASTLLWLQLRESQPVTERSLTRPLQVLGLAGDRVAVGLPAQVQLRLRGPSRLLEGSNLNPVNAYVDLSGVDGGDFIRDVRVGLPAGVELVSLEPARVEARVERYETKTLMVFVYNPSQSLTVEPSLVEARGPMSLVAQAYRAIGYTEDNSDVVLLTAVDIEGKPLGDLILTPDRVRVIERGPLLTRRTLPLRLQRAPQGWRVLEASIPPSVEVQGDPQVLRRLERIEAKVPLRAGRFEAPLELLLPEGVQVVNGVTGTFRIERVQ